MDWKEQIQLIRLDISQLEAKMSSIINDNQGRCLHPELERMFVDTTRTRNQYGFCRVCGYAEYSSTGGSSKTFGYHHYLPKARSDYAKKFVIGRIK